MTSPPWESAPEPDERPQPERGPGLPPGVELPDDVDGDDYRHVDGHRIEYLPPTDSHRFVCVDCAGHADDLDAYRADDCDNGGDR